MWWIVIAASVGTAVAIMLLTEWAEWMERRIQKRERDQLARDIAELDAAIDRVLKEHSK